MDFGKGVVSGGSRPTRSIKLSFRENLSGFSIDATSQQNNADIGTAHKGNVVNA